MIGEHYRNAMHWRQAGAAACGQRTASSERVTRHCTTNTKRVTCAKCMRLVQRLELVPLEGEQLALPLD